MASCTTPFLFLGLLSLIPIFLSSTSSIVAATSSSSSGGVRLGPIRKPSSNVPAFREAPAFRNGDSCGAERIHVTMTLDANYLRGTMAAVLSILQHSACPENIEFHFLWGRFEPEVFSNIMSTFPYLQFRIYRFDSNRVRAKISKSIRQALDQPLNYARIYLADILPSNLKRIIYLDSDLVVVDDIARLWEVDLKGKVLGAPEYCHANLPSVMVVDIEMWRQGVYTQKVDSGAGWSFGGLIKTLTTKSESVIEIYRRDLKEFGSGLKKEIEVAHGSLETVGHAIDEVGSSVLKNTVQIISQGKEAILAADHESDSSDNNNEKSITSQQSLNSKPYSRFDAQVRAIQGDASTYCEETQDLEDYKKWKLRFVLEEKREEIENLLAENGAAESIYKRVVPNSVDEETFWCTTFKLYKLKQAEDVRANLVKRAISTEEDDLSWEFDDDEENVKKEDERNSASKANFKQNGHLGSKDSAKITEDEEKDMHDKQSEQIVKGDEINKASIGQTEQTMNVKEEISVVESKEEKILSGGDNVAGDKLDLEKKSKEETLSISDEKAGSEGKGDNGESSKDSDVSVISSHLSMPEEEDLGWDEIEDLSSIDEKKVSHSGSPNKIDMRKGLSAAEEEEDLSWDIEDDDEPVKDLNIC
ncbi:hypothetical protein GH714_037182 [Hevea brasiliensis]|uniref:Hexosyltransferase n=1 Tax=Hevea brasiliensis TaxID=3981 RepID=A0A6A6MMD2_HEVBR|nr:hypothetical protein GH714_037182 [Hevea brasiliensis]